MCALSEVILNPLFHFNSEANRLFAIRSAWEHMQSATIKTKQQTPRHQSWVLAVVFYSSAFICLQSHRGLMQEWPGLTLIFCLYCKAKVWLLPSTLEKYPASCYQQIFQGGSIRHPLDVYSWLPCRKAQISGIH